MIPDIRNNQEGAVNVENDQPTVRENTETPVVDRENERRYTLRDRRPKLLADFELYIAVCRQRTCDLQASCVL